MPFHSISQKRDSPHRERSVRQRWGAFATVACIPLVAAFGVASGQRTAPDEPEFRAGIPQISLFSFPGTERGGVIVPQQIRADDDDRDALVGTRCTSCHRFESGFSHPVDVSPAMEIPDHLPLENGLVGCTTCHEGSQSPGEETTIVHGGLRGDVEGAAFCRECHAPTSATRSSVHGTMRVQAHLQPGRPGLAQRAAAAGADARGLDTAECLACHDGSVGRNIDHSPSSTSNSLIQRMGGVSHPVGVMYPADARRQDLVPTSHLDPRLRLHNGVLECGTCHSPYSEHDHLLVMSNDRSALCLSCHTFK